MLMAHFYSFIHSYIHLFLHSSSKHLLGLYARHWRQKANETLSTIYQTHIRSFNLGGVEVRNRPRIFLVFTNPWIKHIIDPVGLEKSLHP